MAIESTDDVEIVPIEQEEEYLAVMSLTIGFIALMFAMIWLVIMVSYTQENLSTN